MHTIRGNSGVSYGLLSDISVLRAAQVLLSRLGHDLDAIQRVIDAGRETFFKVARAELRGFGLSSTDLDRVLQLVRNHLTSCR